MSVDLGSVSTVKALQLNFAENNTRLFDCDGIKAQQYLLQYSNDKKSWRTLIDKTANEDDLTHQYHAFKIPVNARYLKLINYRVPDGTFAVSGFRVFGSCTDKKPAKVISFEATRNPADSRNVSLSWNNATDATG